MARPLRKDEAVEPEEDLQEPTVESANDESVVEVEFEEVADFDEEVAAADADSANDSKFTCSIDVRRKIEELEELKMMRDELGFDEDLD